MTLWLDGQTGGTGLDKAECFDSVTVTCVPVFPPPSITQQPSAQNLCAGGTATFSVIARPELARSPTSGRRTRPTWPTAATTPAVTTATLTIPNADTATSRIIAAS